jgi:hypothetical protein
MLQHTLFNMAAQPRAATAERPVVCPFLEKLYNSLMNTQGYFSITLALPDHLEDTAITLNSTRDKLTDKGGVTGYSMLVEAAFSILNTIPKPLLKSTLKETVSLNFYQDPQ